MTAHRYQPRGACAALLADKRDEVLVSGPAGTGKSRACLEKMMALALKYPGMRGLMVRKTAVSLSSTALVTWRTKVAPEALRSGMVAYYGGSQEEPAQYRFKNGSTLVIGGMDKATKIMSSEYDVVYVQEATELTVDDWEAITTRLRNGVVPYQQIIADCNPDRPGHWLNERSKAGATAMLQSRHEDNPLLFDGNGELTLAGHSYISKLDALTGVRRDRLRYGKWVAAEGLVYEDYDPAVHLIDRFDIPPEWDRYWVIDFGFTNPFVLQWWAEDPDGRLYLYREIYRSQRLVEDHAKDALDIVAPKGIWAEPKPVAIICDHDAEDRATFTRHTHLPTTPAKKAKTKGIQSTQARFKIQKDGKPRIFFLRDSVVHRDQELADAGKPTSTIEELTGYVWPQGKTGDKAEEPVKEDDHGMDDMRYMVAHRDRGEYNIRWL
ncbi:MAG TPA: phage terminase large subunit [Acidimicrobiia bacterium]|nr:phage terminase large subunit [Acidimicrobiia bacterium]